MHVVDSAIRPDIREDSDIIATLLFLRMLYFSISTGSLCGTSAIEPLAWYGGLTVSLQVPVSACMHHSTLYLNHIECLSGSGMHLGVRGGGGYFMPNTHQPTDPYIQRIRTKL